MKTSLSRLPFVAFAALLLCGCDDDDTSSAAAAQQAGPASFTIVAPKDGDCVVLRADEQWTVLVTLSISNWAMRAPGYCGSASQCGHAVVFVDDTRVAQTASFVADVPMQEGDHVVRVELRTDADAIGIDGQGKPLSQTITVHALSPGSSCTGDAGTDAGADAPQPDAAPEAGDAAVPDADAASQPDAEPDGADDAAPDGDDASQPDAGPDGDDASQSDAAPDGGDDAADAAVPEAGSDADDAQEQDAPWDVAAD